MIGIALLMLGRAVADPVISELMASNDTALADEDSDYSDWIEIHNPDASSVDLTGWHLSDDATMMTKWTFPAVSIPAGGYLVVFASDKNRAVTGSELHTNFKLTSAGEYLALVKPDGSTTTTDFDPYPAQQTGVSYGIPQGAQVTNTAVDVGASLRFHVPAGAVANWNTNSFNHNTWSVGTAGIGYERNGTSYDPFFSTDIESVIYGISNSAYLRIPFNITDPTQVTAISFLAKFDDGFAAYLNGQFITSSNTPSTLAWNSKANSSIEADLANYQTWDATSLIPHLVMGTNTLAIQMLNQATNSSDFLMVPKLEIVSNVDISGGLYDYFTQPTPGTINTTAVGEPSGNVTISEPSGVKTATINVTLTAAEPSAEIRYTLNGTEPSDTSTLYTTPLAIADPARLRARSFESGKIGGPVAVVDYSFLDSSMLGYLSDVPIIVMDNFGAGSYPNKGGSNDGHDVIQVPRQANVMSFFDTSLNGQPFTQQSSLETRSGCRVRGSSSSTFVRKSLSVEFWDEGDADLDLSPFGIPAEADWVLYAPEDQFDKPLIHNPVSFGFAKMIGALAPESKVVVVFQNTDGGKITSSDLAGVYVLMEKVERNRMDMDFKKMDDTGTSGGWMVNIDRMPPIPVGMPADTIQPNFHAAGPDGILSIPDDQQNSGGSQSVDDISEFYHSYLSFGSPDAYDILALQRNTVQGDVRAMDAAVFSASYDDPMTGYAAHLDADSWARAYAVQNFAKNNDAIVLSTYIFRENQGSKIKMGSVWDFDRSYTANGSATSSPLIYSNRDWYGGLFQDINFTQLHQDIWQEARLTTATDSALEALVDDAVAGLRSDQITASNLSYATWLSHVSNTRTWVVDRANYLDSQYEDLPTVTPETELFSGSLQVTMTPTAGGTVYFTTDGSDPRAPGGGISPSAQAYSSAFTITARTRLIVRTMDGIRWSGKIERNYYQLAEIPQLVISEIAYHPADPTSAEAALGHDDSDDFEYLEIQNIGTSSADLRTLALTGAITFDFSSGSITTLAPGARVLVVRKLVAFVERHGTGLPIAGDYQGALNNAGDQIILKDALLDIDIQNFSYDDESPWPLCADGDGYSLILKQPETNPDHSIAMNWRCSSLPSGNPGSTDAVPDLVGDPSRDDDGDGLSALVEHFLGTSDLDAGQGHDQYNVGMITLPSDGLSYPVLNVRYLVGADDVIPSAIWSQDLQAWSELPADIVLESHVMNGDGTAIYVWRSTRSNAISPQFFRLKVTEP